MIPLFRRASVPLAVPCRARTDNVTQRAKCRRLNDYGGAGKGLGPTRGRGWAWREPSITA